MNPWTIVRAVLLATDLTLPEKVTLIFIRACQNADGQAFPSVSLIAEALGGSKRSTVQQYLRKLQEEGFVERQQRDGKSTVYTLPPNVMDAVIKAYLESSRQHKPAPPAGAPQPATARGAPPPKVLLPGEQGCSSQGSTTCSSQGSTKEEKERRYLKEEGRAPLFGNTLSRQKEEQTGESSAPIVSGPHFNGVGFVVRPGVYVRHEAIEAWRSQYPHLNVKLKVEQLGMWLGRQAKHDHWGLQHPEDWMRTKIAEEAAQAKAAAKPKMQTFKR